MIALRSLALLSLYGVLAVLPAAVQADDEETIKSLENKTIEVKPSRLNPRQPVQPLDTGP